jgi:hypothetical protein
MAMAAFIGRNDRLAKVAIEYHRGRDKRIVHLGASGDH